jgi:aryl-alcohol dehydrogenase-like predicted oxidoreductase
MPEAFASFNQRVGDEMVSTIEAARRLDLTVVASASLYQARLVGELPVEVVSTFEAGTSARCALQFVRSTPGVACALVGMSRTTHVRENLGLLETPAASPDDIRSLFVEDA